MVAGRANDIKPFIVMDVLEKACELECQGYLRFSYANSIENIAEGMQRLEAYIKSL